MVASSASYGWLEGWVAVALGTPLLVFAWIFYYSQSLKVRCSRGSVPVPGRFWQLPIFGETIQALRVSHDDFLRPHIERYGPVFRTHLWGSPMICVATAEAAKFVLQSPKFKSSYDEHMQTVLGNNSILAVEGELHALYRRLILAPLTPEVLKPFTLHVDNTVKSIFKSWGVPQHAGSGPVVINTLDVAKRFSFSVASLFACDSLTPGAATTDALDEHFRVVEGGITTLPINLPGTGYNRALKARQEILRFFGDVIDKRRAEKGSVQHDDLVDSFLSASDKNGRKLNNDEVADNLFIVMFAATDTTANSLSWLIQNLCLHPTIFKDILAENDALAKRRTSADDPLTWDDLQQLPLSLRAIQETMRTITPVNLLMRVALEDVEYDGMLFAKGTKVGVWSSNFHLDPKNYPDPYKFHPDRFKSVPKTNTYTPFGNGPRVCPGRELAKMEMLVFLHRLTQSFQFEADGVIDVTKVTWWPVPHPTNGLPLRITRRSVRPI